MALTGEQLDRFHADGYLPLGALMSADELESLRRRTDDLTAGRVPPGRVGFQLDEKWRRTGYDSTGYAYAGPSDGYRKIGGLEWDPVFYPVIAGAAMLEVIHQLIPQPLAIHRAMILMKPAHGGTALGWHQDTGTGFPVARHFLLHDLDRARRRRCGKRGHVHPAGKPVLRRRRPAVAGGHGPRPCPRDRAGRRPGEGGPDRRGRRVLSVEPARAARLRPQSDRPPAASDERDLHAGRRSDHLGPGWQEATGATPHRAGGGLLAEPSRDGRSVPRPCLRPTCC